MFTPKYRLSQKLLTNITQIERLYGQLEALRIPKNLELNLERNNLVQSSYISNSIEGNPLSLSEVTNLLLGDRVPANRDEKEVKNYFEILRNLDIYVSKDLSLAVIEEIHQKLLTGVNEKIAGLIRNKKVVIGKYINSGGRVKMSIRHEPPFHSQKQIETELNNLIIWRSRKEIPAVIINGVFHHQFVYIHPFEDGNGRVCRLLTALLFLQFGYMINKYFVLDDWYDIDRILYSDKLHSADSGDKTEWLEYFSDGVKYSLQGALVRVKNAMATLDINQRPTTKEKQVLKLFQTIEQMTSTDLVKKINISRQQAHNLLRSLVNKGFLGKKGQTKSAYYFLK
jgi:Fic family protein